jgi:hypothetical protein
MSAISSSSIQNNDDDKVSLSIKEMSIVQWEEWALAVEEHYHALELWKRDPNGLPMGHR